MNERIEKLAEQCGFRSNPDIYDRNQSFDIERFAELIVQECIDTVSDCSIEYCTRPQIVSEIKEHFGVRE